MAPKTATGASSISLSSDSVGPGQNVSPRPARPSTAIQRCCSSSVSGLKYQLRWLWVILKTCLLSGRSPASGGPTSKPMRGRLRWAFTSWGKGQSWSHFGVRLLTVFVSAKPFFPCLRTFHGSTDSNRKMSELGLGHRLSSNAYFLMPKNSWASLFSIYIHQITCSGLCLGCCPICMFSSPSNWT